MANATTNATAAAAALLLLDTPGAWSGYVGAARTWLQTSLPYDLEFVWTRLPFPPIYLTYAIMTTLATAIVAASSYATVHKPTSALSADKMSALYHPLDDAPTDSDASQRVEASEAYLMPVLGGISLLSIYFALKYFNADNIQVIFSAYFALVSTFSTVNVFSMSLQSVLRKVWGATVPHWRWTLSDDKEYHNAGPEIGYARIKEEERQIRERKLAEGKPVEESDDEDEEDQDPVVPSTIEPVDQHFNIYFSLGEVLGFPLSISLVALQYLSKHWIFGNILGASVAVQGVRTIKLGSFKVGFIMLAGLFLYDIYFVFGTDVMMTVATKIDVPIKLEVPRPSSIETARATAMLGLGDIVVPALFLSMSLRFDLYRHYLKHNGLSFHLARPYAKPYFTWGLVSYTLGLVVTVSVMHVFKAGQPALLYLCPAIAGSTLVVAWSRNELAALWEFKDMDDAELKEKKREERKAAQKAEREAAQRDKKEPATTNEKKIVKEDGEDVEVIDISD